VQVLHRERRHLARADHDDVPVVQTRERLRSQVGAEADECVGRCAERGLLPDATARAPGRVEHAGEQGAGGTLRLGAAERLANLRIDLRLAEHHRVQPRRDLEEVIRGVALPVGVQRVGELLGRDPSRLAEHSLQREEPRVVRRDVAEDLDAVARRQDHGLLDRRLVERGAVGLHEIVVGEREPLQQLDRCATEGDAESEDAHE
jgi:hypothetical protein